MLDCPLDEALSELAVAPNIRDAVTGDDTRLGNTLGLVLAYERASWAEVEEFVGKLALTRSRITCLYRGAIAWSESVLADSQVEAA